MPRNWGDQHSEKATEGLFNQTELAVTNNILSLTEFPHADFFKTTQGQEIHIEVIRPRRNVVIALLSGEDPNGDARKELRDVYMGVGVKKHQADVYAGEDIGAITATYEKYFGKSKGI